MNAMQVRCGHSAVGGRLPGLRRSDDEPWHATFTVTVTVTVTMAALPKPRLMAALPMPCLMAALPMPWRAAATWHATFAYAFTMAAALPMLAWLRCGDNEEWRAAALGRHGRQVEPHVAPLLRLVLRVPAW